MSIILTYYYMAFGVYNLKTRVIVMTSTKKAF